MQLTNKYVDSEACQIGNEQSPDFPPFLRIPVMGVPNILISNTLSRGQAALAAAHASLAYYLKLDSAQQSSLILNNFSNHNIQLVSDEILTEHTRIFQGLPLTESSLGGRQVSFVYPTETNIEQNYLKKLFSSETGIEVSKKSISAEKDLKLKMYILINNFHDQSNVLTACANSSIACYQQFKEVEAMINWVNGTFFKVICMVNQKEFELACKAVSQHNLIRMGSDNEIIAAAFCPQTNWPKLFSHLRLYR